MRRGRTSAGDRDGPGYRAAVCSGGGDPAQVPVRDIMTRNCATVSPGDDCREATRVMAAQQVRRLPVTEGGKIVGIVSLGDLAKCQAFDMEAAKALSEISENIIRP